MDRSRKTWSVDQLQAFGRCQKYPGRLLVENPRPSQLDAAPRVVPNIRGLLGTSHYRSFCHIREHPAPKVQLTLLGCGHRSYRCVRPKLEWGKQFCQCPLGFTTQNTGENLSRTGRCNCHCSTVQSSTMVSTSKTDGNMSANKSPCEQENPHQQRCTTRTPKKPALESPSLADIWENKLSRAGWSVKSIKLADVALATSTRRAYDLALLKCRIFANQNRTEFPPVRSCDLAEYICYLAEGSVRPQSVINTFLAAIKQLFRASGLTDISEAYEIKRLVTAVTKAQTDRIRSAVLHVDIIPSTIKTWGHSDSRCL